MILALALQAFFGGPANGGCGLRYDSCCDISVL